MKTITLGLGLLLVTVALTSCVESADQVELPEATEVAASHQTFGLDSEAFVMTIPATTASDVARRRFNAGVYAMDMGRLIDATEHFQAAVDADPGFAYAYLNLANSSSSLDAYTANLAKAEAAAASAGQEEKLLIEIERKGFDGDLDGQLATAQRLVAAAPNSPRALLSLARAQSALNEHEAARASIEQAIQLTPSLTTAHVQIGNSYLFGQPRDLTQAELHFKRAAELAPQEPIPHDLLGDVYRAQGRLEDARDAYSEAAKYSGEDGSPYQQRGHVNSFLGDYEAARADYDRSMRMARGNQAASYGVYRAFVNVHAGEPAAAIAELKALSDQIDFMNIPEPTGLKIFALGDAVTIALHHGMIDEAETLITEWRELMNAQSEQVNTEEFRQGQDAIIAYVEGRLAVKKGQFDEAAQRAADIARLVEPFANPRKLEPVHELQGEIALAQGKYEEAATHLRQGDLQNDIYTKYQLAEALEGAGKTDEAIALLEEVATWNFNGVGAALTRSDALQRVSAQ